ncbi:cell division protein Fic [Collibacillus ludicampi]|uniref:Cell division protein Fic n=1 Tax=Collibacillus ludicampi TaxID=2771369 RepID=A0AAV4LNA9_9BACL|nr:Fic family protein [Collibacillus ludicampi]GIM48534.1 cell division protein Fic [Collibacillus ludicampi]
MMSFRNQYLQNLSYTGSTVKLIARIHEYKGKEALFQRQKPEVLEALRQVAIIQSTESSNRIEGITISTNRLERLLKERLAPENRSEAEIAGYREVLDTIHSSYEHIRLTPNVILQLHRDLMELATGAGGRWKLTDNDIREKLPNGQERIRFTPVPAWKTAEAVEELCRQYNIERDRGEVDDLILIAAFVLDFLCIHPFSDGNGRMARLLTLLLLYQAGYIIGRYISLEKVIEDTKEQYYETLEISSQGWHEGKHNIKPWLDYFLMMILNAYKRFEERAGIVTSDKRGWKQERVRTVVEHMIADFTVSDVEERCPGISRPTITKVLNEMGKEGVIECIERGRNARWRKV